MAQHIDYNTVAFRKYPIRLPGFQRLIQTPSNGKNNLKRPGFISKFQKGLLGTRFHFLVKLTANLERPLEILDVGGTQAHWKKVDHQALGEVQFILFNIRHQAGVTTPFSAVQGDGRDLSRYDDDQFELVYSNSVINMLGNHADQERMAREIQRVGKRFFVQTPNHTFPLDWRTLVPFFHFLPKGFQAWCLRQFPVGIHKRVPDREKAHQAVNEVRDLRHEELMALFPGATIEKERVWGMTKSFMVYGGFGSTL